MKYLIFLLLIGCQVYPEPEYRVDPRLQMHVNEFYHQAAIRGIDLHKNIIVSIEDIDAAGQAFKYGDQAIVIISPNTYEYLTSGDWVHGDSVRYGLENLVFHELGHAVLRRKHCEWYSLMDPNISMFAYVHKPVDRQILVDELFAN
jgi:hypothetical protein